jgi:hypothetical protein
MQHATPHPPRTPRTAADPGTHPGAPQRPTPDEQSPGAIEYASWISLLRAMTPQPPNPPAPTPGETS